MPDKERKKSQNTLLMCIFISFMIGIQGIVMAFICLKEENFPMVIATLLYSFLMLSTFVVLHIKKNPFIFFVTGSIMVIFIEVYFLYTGGSDGFGVIWMAIVPLFTLFLLPYKGFMFLNSLVFAILLLSLLTPLNKFIYDYPRVFEIRFPILYFMEFLFAYFLKNNTEKTNNELEKQKEILTTEINQASKVQSIFLKHDNLFFNDWDTAYTCIPMAGVSGDLFDYYVNPADSSVLEGLGIYDISGHGISSGILSLLAKNIMQQEFYNNKQLPLQEIVQRINDRFIQEKGPIDNYITGIVVRILGSSVELVNSGHQFPFLYKKSTGEVSQILNSPDSFGAIGLTSIQSNYNSISFNMESGDELILFTDGITDCHNLEGKTLGKDGFLDLLKKNVKTKTVSSQLRGLIFGISNFMDNAKAEDDMTIIILRKK